MQNKSDAQLLGDYAAQHSDPAFAEIVARHTDLVYSAALRQTGSPELAREIAQSVFTDLARKARALAGTLSADASLAGWLFRSTRFAGLKLIRDDHRRQTHERQFMEHFHPASGSAPDWDRIAPVLDEAMAELDDADHEAVLLRYFQNQDFHAVGRALGVSDDAAQKRVSRAVDRLRELLTKRGVTAGASGLMVLISANAVVSVPTGLAAVLAVSAVAAGGVAGLGLGVQFAALAGKFGLPAVVSLLVLGTVALVAWRETRSPGTSPTALTALASSTPPATATAPGQNTARAVGQKATAVAVPADTTQRDWALKLYREGEELQRNKQFDEALAKFNMAAAIIESGLPPERWMTDFYFTRATMRPEPPARSKRSDAEQIDDYSKLLRIDPNYSSALANRAMGYAALKQYAEANADFTRLIEDPSVDYSHYIPGRTNGMAWAYEYRGRMWLDARRPAEAIPDLQNAVALYDKPYEKVHVQFYLAASYKASQQHDQLAAEANSMAEQALKWATRPGGTSEEQDLAKTAARWANELLDYKASYQLETVAAVQAKLGEFTEAVREQERALRELPASAENQREAMQARLELYRARKSLAAP